MRRLAYLWALAGLFVPLSGCIALRSDIDRVDARMLMLDKRLQTVEGTADKLEESFSEKAEDTKKSLFSRMNEVQGLVRSLKDEIKLMDDSTRDLQGRTGMVEGQLSQSSMGTQTTLYGRVQGLQRQVDLLALTVSDYRREVTGLTALNETDSELYEQALAAYNKKAYAKARDLWEKLLVRFPKSNLVANAHFWIGEVYYQRGEWINAIDKYKVVIDQYAKSNKAPAAFYKAALALSKLGEKDLARDLAKDLRKKYPDSDQAKKAKSLLGG